MLQTVARDLRISLDRAKNIFDRNLFHTADVIGATRSPVQFAGGIVMAAKAGNICGQTGKGRAGMSAELADDGAKQTNGGDAERRGEMQRAGIDAEKNLGLFEERDRFHDGQAIDPIDRSGHAGGGMIMKRR